MTGCEWEVVGWAAGRVRVDTSGLRAHLRPARPKVPAGGPPHQWGWDTLAPHPRAHPRVHRCDPPCFRLREIPLHAGSQTAGCWTEVQK